MSWKGRSPDEWLVVDGGRDLTEEAWKTRSNAAARGLVARGVAAGTRVGLLFDGRCWADFAVAHAAVGKAGGVAVLLSPGAAPMALARALIDSGVAGLVAAPHVGAPSGTWWTADVGALESGQGAGPLPGGSAAPADVVYPAAALAPREPSGNLLDGAGPVIDGWLVHGWAPGTGAGRHAMALLRAGQRSATVAGFDPHRFCRLVEARQAVACGLTPALAGAIVATGAGRGCDLSSVTQVVLSGRTGAAVRAKLQLLFAGAEIGELDRPAPSVAGAPVAVSQEGMLWHEQFTAGSFNLPCLVRRYQGPLDVAALEGALAELVRRHEPLRTTFLVAGGRPGQVVHDHGRFSLQLVDLGDLGADERDAHAARLLADATSRPFDLATGPLFEPSLVRLGPDDHLLVIRLHHTVFDDWSVDVLRRELSALYTARLAGAPSPLVEPPTRFADFCRRQRAKLDGERGAAQRAWWRQELAGAPLAVQLPIGDGGQPQAGQPLRFDLPAPLAAALRSLAPQLRATPFMTVLAAFSVLLSQATGQDDLVIATVVAHRDESDVEPLIGCFTKKVPLRLRLDGDPTFTELVARTRTSRLGSLAHQDVAFDAAVQIALGGPAADHGVVPQVAVVFQAEAPQRVRLTMPHLTIGPYEVRAETRQERHFSSGPEAPAGRVDAPVWGNGIYLGTFLILSLMETADGLALVARGVFDRPAARRMLEDFQGLLAGVVADPARPLSELGGSARVSSGDEVDVRGFRASRFRIEAALNRCRGVEEVAVAVRDDGDREPRLVAYVVVADHRPPTLTELRHALWAALPGMLWPAEAVVVEALPRRPDGGVDLAALAPGVPVEVGADPGFDALTAVFGGGRTGSRTSYWQDFSFLEVLTDAREAGIAVGDVDVVRCRTPEMLATAFRARNLPT